MYTNEAIANLLIDTAKNHPAVKAVDFGVNPLTRATQIEDYPLVLFEPTNIGREGVRTVLEYSLYVIDSPEIETLEQRDPQQDDFSVSINRVKGIDTARAIAEDLCGSIYGADRQNLALTQTSSALFNGDATESVGWRISFTLSFDAPKGTIFDAGELIPADSQPNITTVLIDREGEDTGEVNNGTLELHLRQFARATTRSYADQAAFEADTETVWANGDYLVLQDAEAVYIYTGEGGTEVPFTDFTELTQDFQGVQSDWDETDDTSLAYIDNKPELGALALQDDLTADQIAALNIPSGALASQDNLTADQIAALNIPAPANDATITPKATGGVSVTANPEFTVDQDTAGEFTYSLDNTYFAGDADPTEDLFEGRFFFRTDTDVYRRYDGANWINVNFGPPPTYSATLTATGPANTDITYAPSQTVTDLDDGATGTITATIAPSAGYEFTGTPV